MASRGRFYRSTLCTYDRQRLCCLNLLGRQSSFYPRSHSRLYTWALVVFQDSPVEYLCRRTLQRVMICRVMCHCCYVDIAVPLWSVCVQTYSQDLFQLSVTSLDYANCLCVLDCRMGDVYGRPCEFSQ